MLNAIAKMTTDAVGAVADTVENALPGKGGKDTLNSADADAARDQDKDEQGTKDSKNTLTSGTNQDEGLGSHSIDESPDANISRSSDVPEPEAKTDTQEENADPEFETTEKKTTTKGKDVTTTHKDDVEVPSSTSQQESAPKTGSTGIINQQALTAGGQPLPKMTRGKTKWIKSSTMWYPDRAGILHAPGVYINRKPRSDYLNPMHKVTVSF